MPNSPISRHASARATQSRDHSTLIAAIDIGSNAVRFALARANRSKLTLIEERRRPTRLGANLAKGGPLPKPAVKATIAAVKEFCFDALKHKVSAIRLVATAAVREAPDGAAFIARLEREVGLAPVIIGPDEEARLAFESCRAAFDIARKEVAIIDIGGGSAQVSFARNGVLYESVSMPLGAVRLTSAFLGSGNVLTPASLRKLQKHVEKILQQALPQTTRPFDSMIGCGGTFAATNLLLGGTSGGLQFTDRPRPLTKQQHAADDLHKLETTVSAKNFEERCSLLKRSKVPTDRAEILPAGLIVASALAKALNVRSFVAHVGGVRDGILRELAGNRAAASMPDEARRFAASAHYEQPHSEHVAHLAVALLSDLADVDRIRESVRDRMDATELLECAGLLHDLGVPIDYDRHHKVARRIVELAPWQRMDREVRAIVANLARYHRKALPTLDHPPFAALSRRAKVAVQSLAGILRIADGLDRNHRQTVHGVRVRITPKRIEITAEGVETDGANIRAAQKKSDLLAAVTRRTVLIKSA